MLDKLEEVVGDYSVVGVGVYEGSSSSLFIHIHHIAKAFKEKRKVIFITTKTAELNLRIIASKLAIRWDGSLLKVVEIGELLSDRLDSLTDICEKIYEICEGFDTVLIEDGTIFEAVATKMKNVTDMVEKLVRRKMGRLFISFSTKCQLYHLLKRQADFDIEMRLIGGGFGKDVTGNMSISRRSMSSLVLERSNVLYLVGDRSMKAFPPGHASIFF